MKFVELLNRNMDELAVLISKEHGKTVDDSKGDIVRGLQRLEANEPSETAAVDVDGGVRATLLQLRHRSCEHGIEVDVDAGAR